MKKKYEMILIDGSSYLFRAYHALPDLMSSKQQPTGAIKGTISMIRKLISEYPESNVIVIFDAKGKTFRNEIYQEYKANRPPMPDDLRSQISFIHQIVSLMGLPLLSVKGVEADDVIGTLVQQATNKHLDVLISTQDKDLAQLVSPTVTLLNTMTDTFLDEKGVLKKFGVRADQIIDYLALVGDASDNIPGVPKCGPKTAVKWLDEFKSLENLIANSEKIKGKIGENLRESLAFLPTSYDLVTIRKNVELDTTLDALVAKPIEAEELARVYKDLEFKAWAVEIEKGITGETSISAQKPLIDDRKYEVILTLEELDIWIQRLKQRTIFALDTETTDIDYMMAELVGISFCLERGKAAYVPIAHDYEGCPKQIDRQLVFDRLRVLLADPKITIIGQNIKYDLSILAKYGLEVSARVEDTMLESYVFN